jgi:hypothetical protein
MKKPAKPMMGVNHTSGAKPKGKAATKPAPKPAAKGKGSTRVPKGGY